MKRSIQKVDKCLSMIENAVIILGLSAMFLILLAQVIMRYVFSRPLTWSEEAARFIFVYVSFIGISYAYRQKGHIRMEVVVNLFPQAVRRGLERMIFLQILRLLAVMVLAFGAGKLASKLKMPVILGWLIAGMVLGPHALNLLDQQTLDAAWFGSVEHLLECVAGLIIGTELLWKKLRSAGRQILVTTVTESLGTFAVVSLVFACVFRITGVPVYLAFLFGGIVLATAPAPSLSIVNELKTNGPVTRTLMPMAALDDLVGATVFFVVVALVSAQISSVGIPVAGMRDEGLLRFDKSRFELLVEMPITEDEPDPNDQE